MSNEPCTKKRINETLKEIFLTSWAFVVYATVFSWFSFGWLAVQIWRVGGLSFTLSALDIIRLAVGFVGFSVCILVLFKMAQRSYKKCEVAKQA